MTLNDIILIECCFFHSSCRIGMGSSPLLTLAHPTLWKSMEHPQFIILYRQEVNIEFLLRFFHQQWVNCELFQYSHMFIKVCHLSKDRRF